ncbi:MAG: hypothetical protein WBA39_00975 [Rivularia sp. (in: cyanobacteria)]
MLLHCSEQVKLLRSLALAIGGSYISPVVLSLLVAIACIVTVILDLTGKHESRIGFHG